MIHLECEATLKQKSCDLLNQTCDPLQVLISMTWAPNCIASGLTGIAGIFLKSLLKGLSGVEISLPRRLPLVVQGLDFFVFPVFLLVEKLMCVYSREEEGKEYL